MLEVGGITPLMDPADALKNGAAMNVWRKMISLQGGDPDAKLPVARENEVVAAERDGVITQMDALGVGIAAWRLGAGRSRQGEKVQAGAGVRMHAKPGELVKKGQPIFTLYTDESDRFERAHEALEGVLKIEDEGSTVNRLPLIIERISAK